MAGLRQERKDRTRRAILDAAGALFLERGYARTTTAEIARQAGIAEGTVFNYFPAKAAILINVLYGSFQVEPYAFAPPGQGRAWLAEEILAFLHHYLGSARHTGKALLREVFSISFQDTDEGRLLLTNLIGMDAALGQELGEHLARLQQQGILPPDADLDGFLQLGYSVVMVAFITYTITEEQSFEEMFEWIRLRITQLVASILLAEPGG